MNLSRIPWLLPVLVMAGCEPFDPWFDYAADDKKLQHVGRMDWSTPDGPTYAHSGVTVRFRCNCTGVDVAFADNGTGGDEHTNWVNVIVDGKTEAKVQLKPGSNIIRGARNLKKGEHTVEIVKRTEPYAGSIQFLGLSLQGVLLDPPPWPEKKMEFIGDSITCGYGDEVRIYAPTYTEPNTGYHSKNEDISQAYGTLIGRRFNAEVVTTCISGTGIYRNLDGSTEGRAFPYLYKRIYPDQEAPLFDTSLFAPDLIVINLGNNDFNVLDDTGIPSAPPADEFKLAYARFIWDLRAMYPHAKIIASVGPMMNDNYPEGRKHWTKMQTWVSEMVAFLEDPNVYYFAYTPIVGDPYGEDWHPTAESHAQMAQELSDFIEKHVPF
ncbi:SGNH/GDSL hydrolase family protein [Vitiosangium sp. GDMCC 1.1324]|uniref:SGNH/GDSL hydrolase family protein n=1 Tax=Vitiosangium sp. (strain GDMCC 1.1324) TaxID=2138576 RepID=UPI000D35FF19|nr:SGNH/GDSL hydrolase family protein [Vitiosangium sp. GDMCC 1.1324]PTL75509.1 acetyl xylan esterase [Vitiosangium sp. GDMCC 1.1324]